MLATHLRLFRWTEGGEGGEIGAWVSLPLEPGIQKKATAGSRETALKKKKKTTHIERGEYSKVSGRQWLGGQFVFPFSFFLGRVL